MVPIELARRESSYGPAYHLLAASFAFHGSQVGQVAGRDVVNYLSLPSVGFSVSPRVLLARFERWA